METQGSGPRRNSLMCCGVVLFYLVKYCSTVNGKSGHHPVLVVCSECSRQNTKYLLWLCFPLFVVHCASEWKPALGLAAIDCAAEENRRVCANYSIRGYPTIKVSCSGRDLVAQDHILCQIIANNLYWHECWCHMIAQAQNIQHTTLHITYLLSKTGNTSALLCSTVIMNLKKLQIQKHGAETTDGKLFWQWMCNSNLSELICSDLRFSDVRIHYFSLSCTELELVLIN